MTAGEHHSHYEIPFYPFGFNLSITPPILIMWGACFVVFLFLFLANRFKRVRQIEELLYDFVVDTFGSNLKNKLWFSFLITLFLFVFFNNLCGLLPGGESPTSNINVTGSLALFIFILSQLIGFTVHRLHHIQNLIPAGIPKPILIFVIPLEIVSQFARPFSLAVRLFANMFAGHKVLTIFVSLTIASPLVVKWLPLSGVVLISLFEIFIAFIQAFIFTYLASYYISDAVHGAH